MFSPRGGLQADNYKKTWPVKVVNMAASAPDASSPRISTERHQDAVDLAIFPDSGPAPRGQRRGRRV